MILDPPRWRGKEWYAEGGVRVKIKVTVGDGSATTPPYTEVQTHVKGETYKPDTDFDEVISPPAPPLLGTVPRGIGPVQ